MKNRRGVILMVFGLLLIAAALFWTVRNIIIDRAAGETAAHVLEQISIPEVQPRPTEPLTPTEPAPFAPVGDDIELPDYISDPEMEMPTQSVDGLDYIGVLSIPVIGLTLPVASAWSYDALDCAPCRYTGSAYTANLVIAGHSYTGHFSTLKELEPGDEVSFTDMNGNVFRYEVAQMDVLEASAVTEMVDSAYALTLFTCTSGGGYRITVRCAEAM